MMNRFNAQGGEKRVEKRARMNVAHLPFMNPQVSSHDLPTSSSFSECVLKIALFARASELPTRQPKQANPERFVDADQRGRLSSPPLAAQIGISKHVLKAMTEQCRQDGLGSRVVILQSRSLSDFHGRGIRSLLHRR
jgi:hypothetical protein